MFRKLLSSIGVGGAKVDTRLGTEPFMPGEAVSGDIYVTGSDNEQEFERIYLSIVASYKHENTHTRQRRESRIEKMTSLLTRFCFLPDLIAPDAGVMR